MPKPQLTDFLVNEPTLLFRGAPLKDPTEVFKKGITKNLSHLFRTIRPGNLGVNLLTFYCLPVTTVTNWGWWRREEKVLTPYISNWSAIAMTPRPDLAAYFNDLASNNWVLIIRLDQHYNYCRYSEKAIQGSMYEYCGGGFAEIPYDDFSERIAVDDSIDAKDVIGAFRILSPYEGKRNSPIYIWEVLVNPNTRHTTYAEKLEKIVPIVSNSCYRSQDVQEIFTTYLSSKDNHLPKRGDKLQQEHIQWINKQYLKRNCVDYTSSVLCCVIGTTICLPLRFSFLNSVLTGIGLGFSQHSNNCLPRFPEFPEAEEEEGDFKLKYV